MKTTIARAAAALLLALGGAAAPAAEKITLTYAAWNLGSPGDPGLERRMLGAWNEENPGVQVVPARGIEVGERWMQSLAAAAAAGTFPDVVMVTTMPGYLSAGWLADLTEIVAADPEWLKIPGPLRTSTTHLFRVWSVPFSMQLGGFFVNKDLLIANNVKVPGERWTLAEFTSIVKALTQPAKPTVGLTEEVDIPNWYPIAANPAYGWFSWDGRAYHLDGAEFKAGIELARSFYLNGLVWEKLPDAARKTINASWHGEAFSRGYAALMWGTTERLGEASAWTFAWDFLPIPGADGRTVAFPSYLGVGRTSAHVEQAYSFARYMSGFSAKGLAARCELVKAAGGRLSLGTTPMTTDARVLATYFSLVRVPSLEKVYARLDGCVVDPYGWVPGYEASRWNAAVAAGTRMDDMIWGAVRGNVRYGDIARQLNQVANREYVEALKALPR